MLIKPDPQADANYLTYDEAAGTTENLYRYAEQRRQDRYKEWKSLGVDEYLSYISDEIKIRTKITQQEIFLIGELLTEVRTTLKPFKDKNFKSWVEECCEFGYHTALNFCNVYAVCMGRTEDIQHIKISTLYKICKTNFPAELRNYLLDSGAIKDMSISKFDDIYKEYKKNGYKSIKKQAGEHAEISIVKEHINNSLKKTDEAIYKLKYTQKTLNADGITGNANATWIYFDEQKGASGAGDFVRRKVHKAFTQCIEILEKARTECTLNATSVKELIEKIDKLEKPVWDEEELKKKQAKEKEKQEEEENTDIIDVEVSTTDDEENDAIDADVSPTNSQETDK